MRTRQLFFRIKSGLLRGVVLYWMAVPTGITTFGILLTAFIGRGLGMDHGSLGTGLGCRVWSITVQYRTTTKSGCYGETMGFWLTRPPTRYGLRPTASTGK